MKDKSIMIQIAHRGLSQEMKDNSKEAFQEAIRRGFEMIELDIQLSKDNLIFIYHDTYIDRFLLKDLDFRDILKLDEDIMLFRDFLFFIKSYSIKIYLDMKGYGEKICDILPGILDECLEPSYIYEYIYIASFNIKQIGRAHV